MSLVIMFPENKKKKLPDRLGDSCKQLSEIGWLQVRSPVMDLSSFFYYSDTLCSVNQIILGPTGIQALPSPVNSI